MELRRHETRSLPPDVRADVIRLFHECYEDGDERYLDRSFEALGHVAVARTDEGELAGFALGDGRTVDLPRLPGQFVVLGGLTCVAPAFRRQHLSGPLQRLAVAGDALPTGLVLSAGRMAHPATMRMAVGQPGAVPVAGRAPSPWQREVGAAVARLYGVERFDDERFVCRGTGTPIGRPRVQLDVRPEEWDLFAAVDRSHGDSLLAVWWSGPPPPGWD